MDVLANINLDLDKYNGLVESIYEAAQNNLNWSVPLNQIRKLFDANYVTLILKSPYLDDDDDLGVMIAVGEDLKDKSNAQYLPYRYTLTPFTNQKADTVFTVPDIMDEEDWLNSSYRIHWCEPNDVFHVMAVDISTSEASNLRFRITRSQGAEPFSEEDKELCQFLVPHLRRALSINLQLERSNSLGSTYSKAIGRLSIATMKIDDQGRVLDQNLFAKQILDSADGLKMVNGKLAAESSSDNRELKQLIHSAFEHSREEDSLMLPEAMSVTRPSGEVNLGIVIEVIPSLNWANGKGQAEAIVYIRDAVAKSQANSDVIKKLFGLTPAETALSLQLTNGLSLEEAAEALNIRRNTGRAHLRSIFSKTGVRRQTELVRIFLNSVAALGYKDDDKDAL